MRDFEDIGRFIRVRSAVQNALEGAGDLERVEAATALAEAYVRFRTEAIALIPEEHVEELASICPSLNDQSMNPQTAEEFATLLGRSKVLLGSLAGFLDGYVQETELRIEAEERARLAAKSVGFAPE